MKLMDKGPRGSGRTSRQMKLAPPDATFVHHNVRFAKELARELGREDLIIVTSVGLKFNRFRFKKINIVVDHALTPTSTERNQVASLFAWITVDWGCDDV